jgi:hypothetical protein
MNACLLTFSTLPLTDISAPQSAEKFFCITTKEDSLKQRFGAKTHVQQSSHKRE